MGIFGTSNDDEVQKLADNASGDSVTKKRLTTTKRGLIGGRNYLADEPIVDLFKDDEQPEYLFPSSSTDNHLLVKNDSRESPSGSYRVILLITDNRICFLIGDKDGDRLIDLDYGSVEHIEIDKSSDNKNEFIRIVHDSDDYIFDISTIHFPEGELTAAAEYIAKKAGDIEVISVQNLNERFIHADKTADKFRNASPEELENILPSVLGGKSEEILVQRIGKEEFSKIILDRKDELTDMTFVYLDGSEGKGASKLLTEEAEAEIKRASNEIQEDLKDKNESQSQNQQNENDTGYEFLDVEGEGPVYSGSSPTVEVTGNESWKGSGEIKIYHDEIRIEATGRSMGSGNRTFTILYSDLEGIGQAGMAGRSIVLQTRGNTYRLTGASGSVGSKEEVFEFLEKRRKEVNQSTTEGKASNTVIQESTSDADELKKYAELKEDGIISEEEFESKKKEILGTD